MIALSRSREIVEPYEDDAEARAPWDLQVPESYRRQMRVIAAGNGIEPKTVLERLIYLTLKEGYEFAELPVGVRVHYRGNGHERMSAGSYSIPVLMVQYLDSIMAMGYSRAYIGTTLVGRGLEIVKSRSRPGHGEDLGSGEVVPSAEGETARGQAQYLTRPLGQAVRRADGSFTTMRRIRIGLLRQIPDSDSGDVPDPGEATFGEVT